MERKVRKLNVLYVDDEEINLRIFKNTFRRQYNIFLAKSAKEGLEILENNKIDLIITDQRMPGMTGLEFLKQINSKFPNDAPSSLMISGYSDQDAIDQAFELYNLYSFVAKPWDVENLKQLINDALTMQ